MTLMCVGSAYWWGIGLGVIRAGVSSKGRVGWKLSRRGEWSPRFQFPGLVAWVGCEWVEGRLGAAVSAVVGAVEGLAEAWSDVGWW